MPAACECCLYSRGMLLMPCQISNSMFAKILAEQSPIDIYMPLRSCMLQDLGKKPVALCTEPTYSLKLGADMLQRSHVCGISCSKLSILGVCSLLERR